MSEVYHLKHRQLHGDYLRPLNELQQLAPEIHAAQVKKYRGREVLQERRVPYLDCLWNDVLFFSSVHPRHIRDGFIAAGQQWPGLEWFAADTVALQFSPENTVVFTSAMTRKKGEFGIDKSEFRPFQPEMLPSLREMRQVTLDYYKEAAAAEEPLFAWHGLPHILHRGRIAFDDLRSFTC